MLKRVEVSFDIMTLMYYVAEYKVKPGLAG